MDYVRPGNLTCPKCNKPALRHCDSPTCSWYSSSCGVTLIAMEPDPKSDPSLHIWLCRVAQVRTERLPPLQPPST